MNKEAIGTFESIVKQILIQNPQALDFLVSLAYGAAEELSSLKTKNSLTHGQYISPYVFKQNIVISALKKVGYGPEDISEICTQGKGHEVLEDIDKLCKPSSTATPSRRKIPTTLKSITFEDISSTNNHL